MAHSIENTTSTNTASIYPSRSQRDEAEGSLSGRSVRMIDRSHDQQEVAYTTENSGNKNRKVMLKSGWDEAIQPLLSQVLPYLPAKDVFRVMSLVSSNIKHVCDNNQQWKERLKTEIGLDLLPILPHMTPKEIYVQILKHRMTLLKLGLDYAERKHLLGFVIDLFKIQMKFDSDGVANALKQDIIQEWCPYVYLHSLSEPLISFFEVKKKIDPEGTMHMLRECLKRLETQLERIDLSNFEVTSNRIAFLISLVEIQAGMNLEEATQTLRKAEEIFEKKGIKNIMHFYHRCTYSKVDCGLPPQQYPDFSKWIKIKSQMAPKEDVPSIIREAQKALHVFIRKFISYGLLTKLFIPFVERRRRIDPEGAINDLREARQTIQDPLASENEMIDALLLIIASARAKIDPKEADNDINKAYKSIKKINNRLSRKEILAAIATEGMLINPNQAAIALKEIYGILNMQEKCSLIKRLVEVDLKNASIIPDEMIVEDIQNHEHRVMILIWLASAQAKRNTEKAEALFDDVLRLNFHGYLDDLFRCNVAEGLAEINLPKAQRIARYLPTTFRYSAAPKIAQERVKQAKTIDGLNEAARIFADIHQVWEIEKEKGGRPAHFDLNHIFVTLCRSAIPFFC